MWAAAGVLVVLLLLVLALMAAAVPAPDRPALDPGSIEPDGSRALVEVLRDRGVDVVPTRRFADVRSHAEDAAAGSTVLIVAPDLLNENIRDELDGLDSDLVLVAPGKPGARRPRPAARRRVAPPVRPGTAAMPGPGRPGRR